MPLLYKFVDCDIRPKLYPVIDFSCRLDNVVNVDKDVISLIEAVKSNEVEQVRNYIEVIKQNKADIRSVLNGANDKHETALCSAVIKKNLDICKLLINNGCDVDQQAKIPPFYPRLSPISQAVIQNSFNIVKLLLSHDCQKDKVDDYGKSAISYAVSNNHVAMVVFLLESGCSINSFIPESGYSLLHDACSKENLETVKILLKWRADPNALEMKDRTSPGFFTNKIEIHQQLIDYGCDINATSRSGDTVLHMAIIHGNVQLVEFLLNHGALMNAKQAKFLYSTENLLCKVTFQDPLELAAEQHFFNICQTLVQHGCVTNQPHSENKELWCRFLNSRDNDLLITLLYDYLPLSPGDIGGKLNLKIVWQDIIELKALVCKDAPSLKASCRLVLRNHLKEQCLGKSIGCSIKCLPLPPLLKEYLMLSVH
ncbi:ankyrin repeat and SOCS box protein 8-like [Mizuhopecten yessoensis]|uniref:Ankyrin repeat protein n=1 Tax=Mizuhopecten yessoensis TaxID=6573 RepID=A0A210QH32_MIZYE|nr:ankyrin repeat and SOCS box protein 8-like [Mizuhopecten yessoensis]OWF48042.1 Ankyrin repeat protein [Mizuhopecten yessoensis]